MRRFNQVIDGYVYTGLEQPAAEEPTMVCLHWDAPGQVAACMLEWMESV
ncbi:hypothetical protein [Ectobacillus ponti]|uniref:Uncharacterized protein n=1 Tax=Ectobacillus ponti TaxID=2961894 RepID=A0AA41XCM2_9BACI|nr:hypothetical protein [Ectobacillus ponti]MCP8970879.1 hypothetical protein [Ectobacillus ponti]